MPRGRPRKNQVPTPVISVQDVDLSQMPLDSFEDYHKYNREARKVGVPCKVPPLSMHKYVKAKVSRLDGQGLNAIRLRKRDQYIDFDDIIQPGVTVDIPQRIADWLPSLTYAEYKQVKDGNGESKTVKSHDVPRFAVQIVSRG